MGNYLAKCSKTFSSQGEWGEEQQKSDRANHLSSDAVHSEHCHQYDQDGGVDDDNAVKLVIFLRRNPPEEATLRPPCEHALPRGTLPV